MGKAEGLMAPVYPGEILRECFLSLPIERS
jgi:hypothetical protein